MEAETWKNRETGLISEHINITLLIVYPVLATVFVLLILIGCLLHYPEVAVVKGRVDSVDMAHRRIMIDMGPVEEDSGRLRPGQKVMIRDGRHPLDGPAPVQGLLEAIKRPDKGKGESGFSMEVYLPDEAKSGRKVLPVDKGHQVEVLIVENDLRLFQRLFHQGSRKTH